MKRLICTLFAFAVWCRPAMAWNPITDIKQNLVWTFGQAAQAGTGYDFAAKRWRTSALAEVAQYRFLSFSYGATFFSERDPQAVDTFKMGILSSWFFSYFVHKPTAEMAWMQNLNIGPSYAIPVFSGQTGHKGVLLLDANFRFGGPLPASVSVPSSTTIPATSKLNLFWDGSRA